MKNEPNAAHLRKTLRCAIYTRKSTEEGLDQDFNSLDAQRESAENYIRSQAHEGWIAIPTGYNDGGFTGSTMDRPGMKALLRDIEGGLVDCIVVYKVDRLSRSLKDFLVFLESIEKRGVKFVSVTQQFNTTESFGRLALNILLSFAQFEREMIADRTRDKMAAARRKGKWVGGNLILGYDRAPNGGSLIINQAEARRVREIFELYVEVGVLRLVVMELRVREWKLKSWTNKRGRPAGGSYFTKSTLHNLLTNVTYTGQVSFKGQLFPGEQPRIIDESLWQKVQEMLSRSTRVNDRNTPNKYGALLKGILRCESCDRRMVHTYTSKGSRIYRYYVCASAHAQGWESCQTRSVPAVQMEAAVVRQLQHVVTSPAILSRVLANLKASSKNPQLSSIATLNEALSDFNAIWVHLRVNEREQFIRAFVQRVTYDGHSDRVTLAFHTHELKELAGGRP